MKIARLEDPSTAAGKHQRRRDSDRHRKRSGERESG